jgi:hypothetical protein
MKRILRLFACCTRDDEMEKNEIKQTNTLKDILNEYTIDIDIDENIKNKKLREVNDNKTETEVTTLITNINTVKLLFEEKLIRNDEKDIITFTKDSLINFFYLLNNYEDYDKIFDKNNLILYSRKGTPLNSEFLLGKSIYSIPISHFNENITIKEMVDKIYTPEQRTKWDESIKQFKILESCEDSTVIRNWLYSPIFLISERDLVDKRTDFYHDDIYYNISTSVPDGVS